LVTINVSGAPDDPRFDPAALDAAASDPERVTLSNSISEEGPGFLFGLLPLTLPPCEGSPIVIMAAVAAAA
jgi:hypothetical protein